MNKRVLLSFVYCFLGTTGVGVALAQPYVFTNVADSSGAYSTFDAPAINNSGAVAFHANRDAAGSGIFTGPDPTTNAIATSDGPYSNFIGAAINDSGLV